jgi:hypothetical protein
MEKTTKKEETIKGNPALFEEVLKAAFKGNPKPNKKKKTKAKPKK